MALSTLPSGELVRSSRAVLCASNQKKKNMGHIALKIMRQIIMCPYY